MKRYINFYLAALLISCSALMMGCAGEAEEDEDIIPEDELISMETEIKLDLAIGDIPSPTKLTSQISLSGGNYERSILNRSTKA